MTNSKNLILQLKQVRQEKQLSFGDILDMMEKNNDFVSKSTLSRLFAEGSEDIKFSYEDTLLPVARAILDTDHIEEDDNDDVRALKSLIQYNTQTIKNTRQEIERLEAEHNKVMLDIHNKIDHERAEWSESIAFLKQQISLKDQRIDQLLAAVTLKDSQYQELLNTIMECPVRKAASNEN